MMFIQSFTNDIPGANSSAAIFKYKTDIPVKFVRFDTEKSTIVDARNYSEFFIDKAGIKHIAQHSETWQKLACSFEEELINENKKWRVKTTDDELAEYIESRCEAVEQKADEYHVIIANTSNRKKAERYKINIEKAKEIKAGTASQNIIDAMQLQLDANKASGAMQADATLNDFCDWLIGLNEKADEGALLIESVRVSAKAAIRNAKSKAEVDAAEQVALQQAQAKFAELMN